MNRELLDRVTCILCDVDGSLFPSEEPAFVASADVTNDFLAALGVPSRYTAEQLRLATTGKNFRMTALDLAALHGVFLAGEVAVDEMAPVPTGPVLTTAELHRWVDEERRRVTAHLEQVLRPEAAVLGPLTRLAAHFQLAAVSSSAMARLIVSIGATELTPFFPADRVFSAEDSLPTPKSKPDPAIYIHACAQLGIRPTEALAVEDSVPGAESAIRAGIRTIGNTQFVPVAEAEERARQLLAVGVLCVVSSWTELEELLSTRW